MNFTPEELKYLKHVLSAASSYTIARGEQIDFPTVKHKELLNKIEDQLGKSTGNKFGFNLLLATTKMKRPSLLEPNGSVQFPYESFPGDFN